MKKPKKIKVTWNEFISHKIVPDYTCPFCKVNFHGADIAINVTRFICDCDNELIVENPLIKKK